MKFNELAWASVCFYYRSAGDKRYSVIMRDHEFLEKIRYTPQDISLKEFEEKAILGFIDIQNYDLLVEHKLTGNILTKIINLQDELSMLQGLSLINCNFDEQRVVEGIDRIYSELCVNGLWITGASKIAHLLNDKLLPPVSREIAKHFSIQHQTGFTSWLRRMQWDVQEATEDFYKQGLKETPSQFLSDKLGYINLGYEKSLAKFVDEYYWLCYSDNLPIPPRWIPQLSGEAVR